MTLVDFNRITIWSNRTESMNLIFALIEFLVPHYLLTMVLIYVKWQLNIGTLNFIRIPIYFS